VSRFQPRIAFLLQRSQADASAGCWASLSAEHDLYVLEDTLGAPCRGYMGVPQAPAAIADYVYERTSR
jgi:hypothetical protein